MKTNFTRIVISLLFIIGGIFLYGQEYLFQDESVIEEKEDTPGETKSIRNYDFFIYDGTIDSFTMRQMNENYLSVSRMVNRGIESIFADKTFLKIKISDWIDYTWPVFINAMTHEEGHRSILTAQGIGSISQPFYNLHGAAYVKGVADQTLIDFRNSDKPSFVRMYTAGIESDYMMVCREEKLAAFEMDNMSILYPDYMLRRLMINGYLCTGIICWGAENIEDPLGIFYKWITDFLSLEKEENELLRDICGFDTFGAAKALFEDNYDFKRYVQYSDLTEAEKDFIAKRVGYRAYLNFLTPFLFYRPNFKISENIALTGSIAYALAPFGDFIDENIYFKYRTASVGDLNFHFYARQAENYKTWYPAFGLSLIEFSPFDWFSVSGGVHIWWQPKGLKFYAEDCFFGGAFESTVKFILPKRLFPSGKTDFLDGVGITTSILLKTDGFLPEIEQHGKYVRFSIGADIRF